MRRWECATGDEQEQEQENRTRGREQKKITSAGGSGSGRGSGVGMGGQAGARPDRHAGDWLTWDDVECSMPCMWDWLSGTEYWLGRDVDLQQLEQVLGPLGHTQLGSSPVGGPRR